MHNKTIHTIKDFKSPTRFAYLLHLWRSTGQWRASLESLETRKRLGFATPEQLFAYLMDLMEGNFNKQSHPVQEQKDEAKKEN